MPATPPTAADPALSKKIRVNLKAKWRAEIRHAGPHVRLRWLKSTEGIIAMGAAESRQLVKAIDAQRAAVRAVACSPAAVEEYEARETLPPGLILHRGKSVIAEPADRQHGARLVLSSARISWGRSTLEGDLPTPGIPTRRFTPDIAIELEDQLDLMPEAEAIVHHFPSPSAIAIARLSYYKQTRHAANGAGHRRGRPGARRINQDQ